MTSQGEAGPLIVLEGALSLKGRLMFCTRWKRKYVRVRADTKQIAIYDKKVSANSTGKRGECLLIQLKQVVACKAAESRKKHSSFLLQKTANAGANRQIIFRCPDPADRDRWIHVINDVMNGKISGRSEFDEVVVSTSALRHLAKARPKNPGRRPPRLKHRALVSSPSTEISGFGDDADSGVGASSELLATHATVIVHKSDDEEIDDVVHQSPTHQESVQPLITLQESSPPAAPAKQSSSTPQKTSQPAAPARQVSTTESITDMDIPDASAPKSEKLSSLQRLKKLKKSGGASAENKSTKRDKNPSLFSRLGARISRAFGGGSPQEEAAVTKDAGKEKAIAKENPVITEQEEPKEVKETHSQNGEETSLKESEPRSARDTFYAITPSTKLGQDKVICELAAIAKNAKLVAEKAEAMKTARLKEEGESSGDEVTPAGKTLSRRDSEKNIEQAAENLRTTLKNLGEAELLEIEKREQEDDETKPDGDGEGVETEADGEEGSSGRTADVKAELESDAKSNSDADTTCKNGKEKGSEQTVVAPEASGPEQRQNGDDNDTADTQDKSADCKEREENLKEIDEDNRNEAGDKDGDGEGETKVDGEGGEVSGDGEEVSGEGTEGKNGENESEQEDRKDLNANQEKEIKKVESGGKDETVLTNGNLSDDSKKEL